MIDSLSVLVLGLNYQPEPTGIAPYTTGMAHFLADAGHDVHVVTGYPHYPYWRIADGYGGLRSGEQDGRIRVTRVRHPVPRDPTGVARIVTEAVFALHSGVVRSSRPDVVIAVSPALLTVGAALRWRRPGRTAVGVVVQDLYGRAVAEAGALGGNGSGAVAALEHGLLSRADGLVAIHDMFRASMIDSGLDGSRISVVRNWTHIRMPRSSSSAVRRELGWRPDETVVLHGGNQGAKQGLEFVVEAARLADAACLPVRFVLLGNGNRRAQLERLAEGVERLEIRDPLPTGRFEEAMAAADVLLLNERPGVSEMCVPSKLTSYFEAGRPVLAATGADGAAAVEIAASGAGLRIEPGSPELLLDGALAVSADPAHADELGANGRRYAAEVLSTGTARAGYLDWLERLASDAGVRARRSSHGRV